VPEKLSPSDRSTSGPFDSTEVGVLAPYLDFGSIRIRPRVDIQIRAEIDEASKRIVALTLDTGGLKLQVQAFAATKNDGLWSDVMTAIEASIIDAGGSVDRLHGALGPELKVEAPVKSGAQTVLRQSRFLGVDGPRWFLRGVMIGDDLYAETNYLKLVELFREVVVHRGDIALPPNELLPLSLPQTGDQ
jgi:hypothetical protein